MRLLSQFRCGWIERLTSARSPEGRGQPRPPAAPFSLGYWAIGLTFLVAAASFHWIEQPMLRIKRRFTP